MFFNSNLTMESPNLFKPARFKLLLCEWIEFNFLIIFFNLKLKLRVDFKFTIY